MTGIPIELRKLIETGPFVHISTVNPDGSPQVTVIWIGLEGDELVSGHMPALEEAAQHRTGPAGRPVLRGPPLSRRGSEPLPVLNAQPPSSPAPTPGILLEPATKAYMQPDSEFALPRGPGYIARYRVERIRGVARALVVSRTTADLPSPIGA